MKHLMLTESELNYMWIPSHGWQFDRIWLGVRISPEENAFMNWYCNLCYFIDNNEWLWNSE